MWVATHLLKFSQDQITTSRKSTATPKHFFPQHPDLSHHSPGRADGVEQKSLWSLCGLFSKRTYPAHFPWFIFQDCIINFCQTRFILNQERQKGLSFVLMPSVRTPTSHIYRVTLNLGSTVLSLSMISIFKRYKWLGAAPSQTFLQAVWYSKSGSSTPLKSQWLPEMCQKALLRPHTTLPV